MTYMWPSYLPVLMDYEHPRYRLWLYQEGIQLTDPAKAHAIVTAARGSAVLFIPGNGGSYKQVRQPFFLSSGLCHLPSPTLGLRPSV
jgi:glycosylphosphatidylinositol deacylase